MARTMKDRKNKSAGKKVSPLKKSIRKDPVKINQPTFKEELASPLSTKKK